jgi:hypothetical protein
MVSRLKTAEVSEARLGNECAHAVCDAEAEAKEEADGLAELAIVVNVSVCVVKNDVEPVVMIEALRDAIVDTLAIAAEVVDDSTSLLLCTFDMVLEIAVIIVEEGVAYGGRFKSGVAVGQPSTHGLTNFAPRTCPAYIGGIVIASLM